jgi:hypothetical protein
MTSHVLRDITIIFLSVIIAIILAETGILVEFLTASRQFEIIGSFLGGFFLVSAFTAAPALVTITEIAQHNSALLVAFFGAIGALIGDLLIFRFVKDSISDDIAYLLKKTGAKRFLYIFRLRIFGWLIPFIGALIVASPLPDEIGLAMMGLSKMKTVLFVPTVFILDFLGILAVAAIAKSLL